MFWLRITSNDDYLIYSTKSTYRFLLKMNEAQLFHKIIIKFLRSSLFMNRNELAEMFMSLKLELIDISNQPFENRSFLYLDGISWLESKIENKPVEQVIYSKRHFV